MRVRKGPVVEAFVAAIVVRAELDVGEGASVGILEVAGAQSPQVRDVLHRALMHPLDSETVISIPAAQTRAP